MVSVEECSTVLPVELVSKILYTYSGLVHPTAHMIKRYVKSTFCEERCFCCLREADTGDLWEISLTSVNPGWVFWKLPIKHQYLVESYNPDQIHICFGCAQ